MPEPLVALFSETAWCGACERIEPIRALDSAVNPFQLPLEAVARRATLACGHSHTIIRRA